MSFSFGIEEEYFLVDSGTKAVARKMPEGFFAAAKAALGEQVTGEFLQSQIEIVTAPQTDTAAARQNLRYLAANARRGREHLRPRHHGRRHSSDRGVGTLAAIGRRALRQRDGRSADDRTAGSVVRHARACRVARPRRPDRRDDADAAATCRCSSRSRPRRRSGARSRPGLKGYRLAAYDELPRTGVPELFKTKPEFDAYIDALVQAGVMPDASYIWWTVRPSLKHPTLELRAPDVCTRIDDSIAIAALYRTVRAGSALNPSQNADIELGVTRAIAVENKWRAQRYGVHGTFARIERDGSITVAEMLEHVIAERPPDAEALGCLDAVPALPDHRRAWHIGRRSARDFRAACRQFRGGLAPGVGMACRYDGGVTCRLRQRTA